MIGLVNSDTRDWASASEVPWTSLETLTTGRAQQVHREDHGRDDPVVPHGHHQGVHQQPLPRRAHLQAEEHQQAGADPAQPAASVQVSCTEGVGRGGRGGGVGLERAAFFVSARGNSVC